MTCILGLLDVVNLNLSSKTWLPTSLFMVKLSRPKRSVPKDTSVFCLLRLAF